MMAIEDSQVNTCIVEIKQIHCYFNYSLRLSISWKVLTFFLFFNEVPLKHSLATFADGFNLDVPTRGTFVSTRESHVTLRASDHESA